MKEKTEAIQFADDRPMSLDDDLYQWAIDAESLIRSLQSRLKSLEKDAAQMHDEIINLRVNEDSAGAPYTNWREAYLWGHRDARHAAAELVTAMQAQGNKND